MPEELNPMILPEAPRGMVEARVDDKGRLKVPGVVLEYLRKFGGEIVKVFVTSMDGETGRIYPISVWQHNEKLLQRPGPQAKMAKRTHLVANIFGQEDDVDAQGRVLLPTNLRRELGLEGCPVWLACFRGRVTIFNAGKLEEEKQAALRDAATALEELEEAGLY